MSSPMPPLPHRRLWTVLGFVLVIAVTISSLAPGLGTPPVHGFDKVEHVGAYFVLMLWFAGLQPRRTWLRVALALLAMGVVLELAQDAMHMQRTADPRDVLANATGIALGATLAAFGLAAWPYRLETWLARK